MFISTYNESVNILRKTIIGCTRLDYPKGLLNICICDDGRRPEIQKLSKDYGITYITRSDNTHAKAGNINNALKYTSGEMIMLLDADMIPKSHFLQRTLGYFCDDNVAFVQTPQAFYNPDPFQHNLLVPEDSPNEQITEDMATSILLQAKGWQGIFVKELMAYGLSAENFSDFIIQRERWARGNIQVAKKWNILTMRGLSLMQRLIYFDGVVYWFYGVSQLIFLIAPLIFPLLGINIYNATTIDLLKFFIPYYMSDVLIFRSFSNKGSSFWGRIQETAAAFPLLVASMAELLFNKKTKFNVTSKGVKTDNAHLVKNTARPLLVLIFLYIVAFVVIFMKYGKFSVFGLTWLSFNLFTLIMALFVSLDKPRYRGFERFITTDECRGTVDMNGDIDVGQVVDISDNGARIRIKDAPFVYPYSEGDRCAITISNFENNYSALKRIQTPGKELRIIKAEGYIDLCVQFCNVSSSLYNEIMNYIINSKAVIMGTSDTLKIKKISHIYLC